MKNNFNYHSIESILSNRYHYEYGNLFHDSEYTPELLMFLHEKVVQQNSIIENLSREIFVLRENLKQLENLVVADVRLKLLQVEA